MKILIALVALWLVLTRSVAVATSYSNCEDVDTESTCVSSELLRKKLFWAGLKSKAEKVYGFFIYQDGDVYIGDMNGAPQGKGQLLDVSKKRLFEISVDSKGNFKRLDSGTIMSKQSVCIYIDEKSIKRQCFGYHSLDNSGNDDYYVGELRGGQPNGYGYYFFEDGYYFGNFENSKFQGKGAYISFYGARYEGEFDRDAFEGSGTLTTIDGTSFVGGFKNDQRNGKGKLMRSNGEIVVGFWDEDKLGRSLTFKDETAYAVYVDSEREAISNIQTLLKKHFFLDSKADGLAGPKTRKAMAIAIEESGAQKATLRTFDLRATDALTSLSSRFLEERGSCGSSTDKWTSCFSVQRR